MLQLWPDQQARCAVGLPSCTDLCAFHDARCPSRRISTLLEQSCNCNGAPSRLATTWLSSAGHRPHSRDQLCTQMAQKSRHAGQVVLGQICWAWPGLEHSVTLDVLPFFVLLTRRKSVEKRDRTGDLQIFSLTLSQPSYRNPADMRPNQF